MGVERRCPRGLTVWAWALVALTLSCLALPGLGGAATPAPPDTPPNLLADHNADFEQPGGGIPGWETAYGEARVVPETAGGQVLE